jgi:BMFP domain-containing protein YqiC
MTDHKATSEQWADAGAFASDTRACLLELRARVEALEADAIEQSRSQEFCLDFIIQRLEKLEAASASTSQED